MMRPITEPSAVCVERREELATRSVVGEDEVDPVRHVSSPGSRCVRVGWVAARSQCRCTARSARTALANALVRPSRRTRHRSRRAPALLQQLGAVAPGGDGLEVPVGALHVGDHRRVVGEAGAVGDDDGVGLGRAGGVERPVDGELVAVARRRAIAPLWVATTCGTAPAAIRAACSAGCRRGRSRRWPGSARHVRRPGTRSR